MKQTKKCPSCGQLLDISEFYTVRTRSDGHCAYCKKCIKLKQVKKNEYYKMYQRRRRGFIGKQHKTGIISTSKEDYHRQYYEYIKNDPYYKNKRNEYRKKNREEHPDKDRARAELVEHVRRGIIKRGVCEICGSKKTDGHHFDYSKPLEVRWLCRKHHIEEHRKMIVSL